MRKLMYSGIVGIVVSASSFVWNLSELDNQPRDVKLADRFASVLACASERDFQHKEFREDYDKSTETYNEMLRRKGVNAGVERRQNLKENSFYSLIGLIISGGVAGIGYRFKDENL